MARRSVFNRMQMRKQIQREQEQEEFNPSLTKNLDENVKTVKYMLGEPTELVIREFMIGGMARRAAIIYITGSTDEDLINNNILQTIQLNLNQFETNALANIHNEVIAVTEIERSKTLDDV